MPEPTTPGVAYLTGEQPNPPDPRIAIRAAGAAAFAVTAVACIDNRDLRFAAAAACLTACIAVALRIARRGHDTRDLHRWIVLRRILNFTAAGLRAAPVVPETHTNTLDLIEQYGAARYAAGATTGDERTHRDTNAAELLTRIDAELHTYRKSADFDHGSRVALHTIRAQVEYAAAEAATSAVGRPGSR
jgi:hypothetical protein